MSPSLLRRLQPERIAYQGNRDEACGRRDNRFEPEPDKRVRHTSNDGQPAVLEVFFLKKTLAENGWLSEILLLTYQPA